MSKKEWKITGAFVAKRLEVVQSPAWRAAPRPLKAWLEVLEVEHMRHKGCANGRLFKSYNQFIEEGFNRNTVSEMSRLAEALGFVKINRETGIGNADLRDACAYTLTYLPTGTGRDVAPTDDWKKIKSEEHVDRIVEQIRKKRQKSRPEETRRVA